MDPASPTSTSSSKRKADDAASSPTDPLAKRRKRTNTTRSSLCLQSLPMPVLDRIINFLNDTTDTIIRPCDPPEVRKSSVYTPPATVYHNVHPLKSLSLVSKLFHTLCLGMLFTAVCIPARHEIRAQHPSINASARSLMAFIASTSVGRTIHSLTLDGDVLNRSTAMLFHYVPCLSSLRLVRSVAFLRDVFPVSNNASSLSILQCLKHLALEGMQVDSAMKKLFHCVSERLETLIVRECTFEGATPFQFHQLAGTFGRLTTFRYHGSGILAVTDDKYPLTISEFIARLQNLTTLGIGFVEDELRIQEDGLYAFFDSPIGVFSSENTFNFPGNDLVQTSFGVRFVRLDVYLRCWTTMLARPRLFTSKLITFAVLEDFVTFGRVLAGQNLKDSLRVQKRTCVSEFISTIQYAYDTALKAKDAVVVYSRWFALTCSPLI